MKYNKKLGKAAKDAMRYSYAPYSKFRVGAALLSKTGKIITGCNIENSSYSLTMCAERIALFKAISEGINSFKAVAIASDSKDFLPPCGACRQVLTDLAGNIDVILVNWKHEIIVYKLYDLLPYAFSKRHLI